MNLVETNQLLRIGYVLRAKTANGGGEVIAICWSYISILAKPEVV